MKIGSLVYNGLPTKCIVKDCTNDAEGYYEVKSILARGHIRKAGICKKHRRKGGSFIRWYKNGNQKVAGR